MLHFPQFKSLQYKNILLSVVIDCFINNIRVVSNPGSVRIIMNMLFLDHRVEVKVRLCYTLGLGVGVGVRSKLKVFERVPYLSIYWS